MLLRIASATTLFSSHHSAQNQPAVTLLPTQLPMGWNSDPGGGRDGEGWQSVGPRRNRWGNGNGTFGGGGGQPSNSIRQLREENQQLRRKITDAERIAVAATDRTKHPTAKDAHQRHGDWMCYPCGFKANRAHRGFCYRCAEPKHLSCGGSPAASGATQHAAATMAAAATPSPGAPPMAVGPGTEAAKGIKLRIASLESARAALAACQGCAAERDRIDQDIAAARSALAVHLPVEVAVKTTLGPAQQARAAVTKAEAKVARIEVQLAALVEQHEAAAAELDANRAKLAEAEAATAKAASIALPAEHFLSAVAADPGSFWAAFKAAILQRCPGLQHEVFGQLDVATKAFEAAIVPVFAHSPPVATPQQQEAATANIGGPLSNPPPPVLAPHNAAEPREEVMAEAAHKAASAAAVAAAATGAGPAGPSALAQPSSAEDAIAHAVAMQQQHHAAQHQQPPMSSGAAFAAAAAEVSRALLATSAAAAATPVSDPNVCAARNAVAGSAGDGQSNSGGGGVGSAGRSADDSNDPMGGGAADNILNKRGFSAVTDAKAIVAKAKAKPST